MKYLLILLVIIGLISCRNESSINSEEALNNDYVIKGKVDSLYDDNSLILYSFDPTTQNKEPLDTAIITEGKYTLQYTFVQPSMMRVETEKQRVMIVVDEGQRDITLNLEGTKNGGVEVIGSDDTQLLLDYDIFRNESYDRLVAPTYKAMREATDNDDVNEEIEAVADYAVKSKAHRLELIAFTKDKLGASLAVYGSMLRWTGDEAIPSLEAIIDRFKRVYPDLYMTKHMEEKVARFKRVALGATASDVSLPDQDGNLSTVLDTTASYTLIDFWASWCRPCLLQAPDLTKAHAAFGDKGLRIIGISVDESEKRWKAAIEKFNLDWPHYSDLKGWESEASEAYNVTFIPYNFLIDEDRKIIAKNLHGMALHNKLAELLE